MKDITAGLMLGFSVTAAAAAEPPRYLDDRSSPTALVRSLYNAINREEYGRAWSYFGDDKPAADFNAYAAGYKGTRTVSVVTGSPTTATVAGDTVYGIPVAIDTQAADGTEQAFAGCYTARMKAPQATAGAFMPLHLERGELKPATYPLEEQLPERCGEGQLAADPLLDSTRAFFDTNYTDQCLGAFRAGTDPARLEPDSYDFSFKYSYDSPEEPEHKARLFRFYCDSGAYNEQHIYLLHDKIGGLREVGFAVPDLDIRFENDDSSGKVESINVSGFYMEGSLLNSEFDPATRSIGSWAKWRGIGDASSIGSWVFRDGHFSLVKFEVDPSYDEEINHHTVVDYETAP